MTLFEKIMEIMGLNVARPTAVAAATNLSSRIIDANTPAMARYQVFFVFGLRDVPTLDFPNVPTAPPAR